MHFQITNYSKKDHEVEITLSCDLEDSFKFQDTQTFKTEKEAQSYYWNNLMQVAFLLIEKFALRKQNREKRYIKEGLSKCVQASRELTQLHADVYDPLDNISYSSFIQKIEQNKQNFILLASVDEAESLVLDNKIIELLNKLVNNLKNHIQWDTLTSRTSSIKRMVA